MSGRGAVQTILGVARVTFLAAKAWAQCAVAPDSITETAKVLASDGAAGDWFSNGTGVAISGDTVVIGVARDDHCAQNAGAAYVFRYNGSSWIQKAELLASDCTDSNTFGVSAAIEGDIIVVGARDEGTTGSAYVFRRDDNGTPGDPTDDFWVEQAKLLASDGAAGMHSGSPWRSPGTQPWWGHGRTTTRTV